MSTTDRNGDPIVSDILDIIDRESTRYKVAIGVAAYVREREVAALKQALQVQVTIDGISYVMSRDIEHQLAIAQQQPTDTPPESSTEQ